MKHVLIFFLLAFVLAGCAAMTGTMSPEQMAQNSKDKNAVVGCGSGSGPWGKVTTVYVDTNKINDNNTVTVSGDCTVTVTGTRGIVEGNTRGLQPPMQPASVTVTQPPLAIERRGP